MKSLSRVQLFATPWTVAYQAPQSMDFSRQEYWSGLPFPSPRDLPDPGIKPGSPPLRADALPSELSGKLSRGKFQLKKNELLRGLCMCAKSLQWRLTLCDPMDCSPPGFPVHGTLQARILEWVAISFSTGSSRPRDQTQVSCIAGRRFNL